jgi:glutamine synthetase
VSAASDLADVDTVAFAVPDNTGRLIGNRFPADRYRDLADNGVPMPDFFLVTGIENSPHDGLLASGVHKGFRNGILRADPSSFRVLSWSARTALVLCDAFDAAGAPMEESPRRVLQRQVARLEERGLEASCATELEFYLFRGSAERARRTNYRRLVPSYHLHGDHDLLVAGFDEAVIGEIRRLMPLARVPVEASHGEGGAGQHELTIRHSAPVEAADCHVVYKHGVKAIAAEASHVATFMAKVRETSPGSSCHVHISLTRDGEPALGADVASMTTLGSQFLAGVLAFSPELTLLHAPSANSYKRLIEGSWAPANMTWGTDNRTCAVRCVGAGASFRFEFRIPGADANPYLTLAAVIAGGIEGIDRALELPPPTRGNAYEAHSAPALPRDLTESVALFGTSDLAARAFGADVRDHYCALARRELDAVRRSVTDWDLERGFERA